MQHDESSRMFTFHARRHASYQTGWPIPFDGAYMMDVTFAFRSSSDLSIVPVHLIEIDFSFGNSSIFPIDPISGHFVMFASDRRKLFVIAY